LVPNTRQVLIELRQCLDEETLGFVPVRLIKGDIANPTRLSRVYFTVHDRIFTARTAEGSHTIIECYNEYRTDTATASIRISVL